MTNLPRYGPPDGEAELRDYAAIVAQAFAGDAQFYAQWLRDFGDGVRVLRDGSVRAGMVFYNMGQFFGGREVGMWGPAGVAVTPETRGSGYARELMLAYLHEQFVSGPAISALYPAAPKLYRGLGWEFAGARLTYAVDLSRLSEQSTTATLRPAATGDEALINDIYLRRHNGENGCLARNAQLWARVRRIVNDNPLYTYIIEDGGEPVGYLTYVQRRAVPTDFKYELQVRELVAVTPGAAAACINLFRAHRSVATKVYLYGAPGDPVLADVLTDQWVPVDDSMAWMLRVVRVDDALEARGYAPFVNAHAEFKLVDEALPGNARNWALTLEGGRMKVTEGGGGPTLDARGLAALYSSRLSPADLRRAGLLSGDESHDSALAAMFAGPAPWMPDFF